MADVVDFPERRQSIPVNLPDIGCAQSLGCPVCERRQWAVMLMDTHWPVEYVCCNCGFRIDPANDKTDG